PGSPTMARKFSGLRRMFKLYGAAPAEELKTAEEIVEVESPRRQCQIKARDVSVF
ncbi:unnamed protein product, partial [Mesorhabditis spiculigera]